MNVTAEFPPPMDVKPLTTNFACEISGVNLWERQSEATYEALRDAFSTHALMVFRRQVLSEDVDSTKIDALTKAIGERQAEIDRKTFSHFRELRALCTPDQREKLNQLFDEVLRMMSPRHRPPHPPRRQNR